MMIVADGGPSGEVTQGHFHLYDGHAESMHRHGLPETVLVIEGTSRAWFGKREVTIVPGDTLLVPPGVMHGFKAVDDMTLVFTVPTPSLSDVDYEYAGEAV